MEFHYQKNKNLTYDLESIHLILDDIHVLKEYHLKRKNTLVNLKFRIKKNFSFLLYLKNNFISLKLIKLFFKYKRKEKFFFIRNYSIVYNKYIQYNDRLNNLLIYLFKNFYIYHYHNTQSNNFLKYKKNKFRIKQIFKNLKNKHFILKKENLIFNLKKKINNFFFRNGKKLKIKKYIINHFNLATKYEKFFVKNPKNFLLNTIKQFKQGLALKKIYKSGKKYYVAYPLLYEKKINKFLFIYLKDFKSSFIKTKNQSFKNNLLKKLFENITNKNNNNDIFQKKKIIINCLKILKFF